MLILDRNHTVYRRHQQSVLNNSHTCLTMLLCLGRRWDAAMAGVSHVIHSASPVNLGAVKDETMLIKPAVEGTLHVLRAAANSRTVKVRHHKEHA